MHIYFSDKFTEKEADDIMRAEHPEDIMLGMQKVKLTLGFEESLRIRESLIDLCDVIYMAEGWECNRIDCLEYGLAIGKDKMIIQ